MQDYNGFFGREPDKYEDKGQRKVAAFDVFDTLFHARDGSKAAPGLDNWIWKTDSVPAFLNSLNKRGWVVVWFSNYTNAKDTFAEKVYDMLVKFLDFQPFFYMAYSKDAQKPNKAMWTQFMNDANLKSTDVSSASFFVGDKMKGASTNPMYNRDSVDYEFAKSIGLSPYAPDIMFPAQAPYQPNTNHKQELVITVGQMGSGKSTFSSALAKKYGYSIEQRKGAKKSYLARFEKKLKAGVNLLIDATSPSKSARAELLSIAKKLGIRTVIAYASQPGWAYNDLRPKHVKGEPKDPDMSYYISTPVMLKYNREFQLPTPDEADYIYRIN